MNSVTDREPLTLASFMSKMNNKELKLSTLYFLSNPWFLTRRFSLELISLKPLIPHSKIFYQTFDPSLKKIFSQLSFKKKKKENSLPSSTLLMLYPFPSF